MTGNLKKETDWPFSVALPFWETPEGDDDAIGAIDPGGRVEFRRGDVAIDVCLSECEWGLNLDEIGRRPLATYFWDLTYSDGAGTKWTAGFRGTLAQVGRAAAPALATGAPPRARLWLLVDSAPGIDLAG